MLSLRVSYFLRGFLISNYSVAKDRATDFLVTQHEQLKTGVTSTRPVWVSPVTLSTSFYLKVPYPRADLRRGASTKRAGEI